VSAADGVGDRVGVHGESSLTYLASTTDRFDITSAVVFHDTSPHRTESLKEWPHAEEHARYRADVLARDSPCSGFFESTRSRGFIAIFMGGGARAGAS
jgi:hypothetical protein